MGTDETKRDRPHGRTAETRRRMDGWMDGWMDERRERRAIDLALNFPFHPRPRRVSVGFDVRVRT